MGNLFTAWKNQTPLVVTAGQQSRSILPYEPFLFAERSTELPRPFVKWAIEPARAQDVPAAIARAYIVAMQPPCGPTFVSIPVDDWDQECAEFVPPVKASASNPGDPDLLAQAAAILASARRPAFVVGAGVARDGAWDAAIALAERHCARVYVAPMNARCSFPENHPLFAGFLPAMREAIVSTLSGHDVILALGGPASLYHIEGAGPHLPEDATTIFIADNPAHASWAPCEISIVADCRYAINTLLAGPQPIARTRPSPLAPPPELSSASFTDAYLLQQIARLRPAGSIIVEEAPSSRGAMHDHLPITIPDSFYTCASGGLGHGLPAAIGIALGRPKEKVIAVLGDGSSMYAIQGLWSAVRLGLPISFIILNNRRYEALRSFGRLFGMQHVEGTNLDDLNFVAMAQGQGMNAKRVIDPADLDAALLASFAADRPTLVEVLID
jgi:benzoylformate decarboxylase